MIYKTKKVNGVEVILTNADDAQLGGKYMLLCANHGFFIQATNKKTLWTWADATDEWCERCSENESKVAA